MIGFLTITAAILFGFFGLIWGADRFVDGAAASARHLGMSTFLIGLTIISFGTSAPEILVAIMAALDGAGEIAIGNALGSNLANTGLVLAITVLISPILIKAEIIRLEIPTLLLVTLAAGYCLYDLQLTRLEGCLLFLSIVPVIWLFSRGSKKHQPDDDEDDIPPLSKAQSFITLTIGLCVLLIGAKLLVWGATELAVMAGVSQLIIGMTVVAVGTSLPELAASIVSALRNHHDIALGNIIGSNIFNILTVMSVPGIIAPLAMPAEVMQRDYMMTALITGVFIVLLLIPLLLQKWRNTPPHLGRLSGVLLLAIYATYYLIVFAS